MSTRSLSDLGLIYGGKVGFGQIFRTFSLNRAGYSPQTSFPSLRSPRSDRLLETHSYALKDASFRTLLLHEAMVVKRFSASPKRRS